MAFDPFLTPVDYFKLGGLKSPGHARIVGAAARRKFDIRSAYGSSSSVAGWLDLAEFKAEIDLYTDVDWYDWDIWKKAALREIKANRRNKASDFATDIWHPWLADLDIKAVIVKSVSQPEEVNETGVYRVTIEFIEYRKVVHTLSKPTAAKAKPEDHKDRRTDAVRDEIERVNQKLAE